MEYHQPTVCSSCDMQGSTMHDKLGPRDLMAPSTTITTAVPNLKHGSEDSDDLIRSSSMGLFEAGLYPLMPGHGRSLVAQTGDAVFHMGLFEAGLYPLMPERAPEMQAVPSVSWWREPRTAQDAAVQLNVANALCRYELSGSIKERSLNGLIRSGVVPPNAMIAEQWSSVAEDYINERSETAQDAAVQLNVANALC